MHFSPFCPGSGKAGPCCLPKRYALLVGLLVAGAAGCTEAETPPAAPPAAQDAGLGFTDVTAEAGLGGFRHETGAAGQKWMPETLGSGGGFVDYDGDGWPDMLLTGGGTWPGQEAARVPALELYRNDRDGTFTRVTEAAGLGAVTAYGFGIAAADYDNDGDADVFVSTLAEDLLLRNDAGSESGTGSGRFAEVGSEAGVAGPAAWSTAALFFDADLDGHLDLYVGGYVDWSPENDLHCTSDGVTKDYCTPHQYEGAPAHFYHNNGDGTFSERTERAGLADGPGKTLGVAELDFNGDGWPDLVVANDTQRNLLYRNRGDGTFEEVGVASGLAYDANGRARAGMGIDVGIVEDGGTPTVFVGNFSDEMVGVYRQTRNGLFIDRGPASGIGAPSLPTLTFGLLLFDADLDGDLDLLLANGHIIEHIERLQTNVSYRQQPQLFLNGGSGNFTLAKDVRGGALSQKLVGRGAAYADYDRDGDLDVLITENGGPVHLLRNELNPGAHSDVHYLRVRLEGRKANRDALGARLVAVAGGRRQERRVRTGGSYLAQSETTAAFGLGAATVVDTLRVYWPGGAMETFEQVAADQEVHLVEGRR